MAEGIRTAAELKEMVQDYLEFDEFVFDVETKGPYRGNPYRNDVFWISLAGPGRADVIPCGHPIGERVYYDVDDETHRINPSNNHYQEHRINETSGRLKWFDIPPQFTPAPRQLWISDVADALAELMFSDRRKIGHNVKFDIRSLAKYYDGAMPPGPYGDTVVAARLVNENHHGYRLGDCVKREFRYQYEKIGKAGPENFPYSEARLYSYLDSKYDWLLWQKLKPRLDKQKVRHIFDMEMDLLPAIIDMEQTGTPIDEVVLSDLGREFMTEMAKHKIAINDAAGFDINLNANRQVAELVYETLGHKCTVFSEKTQQPSTAAATLEAFSKDPVIAHIQEHAKLSKLQSTFIEGITRNTFEGRVHPSFNQVGAVSGRMSCSEPNIQQIPSRTERGKRIREVFIAGPKNVLVVADLSQIELRVLAHFTQDPVLLTAYRNNVDLHGLLARRVFGKEYTPFDRSLAKNGNFCVPMDTEALTLEGWKTYDELSTDDKVAAYKNGVLEWTPVLEKMKFDDAPLIQMENNHFKAISTPNHRWIGEHRRMLGHGKNAERFWERREITTQSFMSEDRIFLSAPLQAVCNLPISADEAALVAWLWCDGHIERGTFVGAPSQSKGTKVKFFSLLAQSKIDGITEIRGLLDRLGITFKASVRPSLLGKTGQELLPVHVWKLDPKYMRDLWERAKLDEITPVQFVADLGTDELAAFTDAAWRAEGWFDRREVKVMAQNEGPVYEALSLAVFLTGRFPTISTNGVYKGTENFNIRFSKPYVNGSRIKKTLLPNAPVWCIRTEPGSWVMRQGHQIMLTGNSVLFGAFADTLVKKYGFPNKKLAQDVLDGFYATYKSVQPWKDDVIETAFRKTPCHVTTILGRKRRLPELAALNRKRRSAAQRQAISVTVSGSAADLFKLAMIECHAQLQAARFPGHILMTIHDELVVEAPARHGEECLAIVKTAMEEILNPFTGEPILSVPIIADGKIVERWSDAK